MIAPVALLLLAPAVALAGKVGRPGRTWADNFVPPNPEGGVERRHPQGEIVSILPVNMTTPSVTPTQSATSTSSRSDSSRSTSNSVSVTSTDSSVSASSSSTSSPSTTDQPASTTTAPRSSRLSTFVTTLQPTKDGEEPVTSTSVLWVSDESTPTSGATTGRTTATDVPEVQPDGMAAGLDAPRGAMVALIGAIAVGAALL